MSAAKSNSEVRYRYPLHAMVIIALAWVFLFVLIAMYSTIAIALFPLSPFVAIAAACMVGMVQDYAKSVREPVRSDR